jgi:phosphoglycolate phosphatase
MADFPGTTLACFGLVGTLIADDGVVELAYSEAIATQGVVSGTSAYARCMAQVHRARGQGPGDVLAALFPDNPARAQAARLAFDRSLAGTVARTVASPIPGAQEVLEQLAASGCRTCVLTILPRRDLTAMLRTAGWRDLITLALTDDDVPRGCPFPDLVLAAMLRAGVGDVREVAVVQGTAAGVECGRRAGAGIVAGVLTGPHPAARLRAAGATYVLDSVAELPAVLAEGGARPVAPGEPAAADPAGISLPQQRPAERRPLGL